MRKVVAVLAVATVAVASAQSNPKQTNDLVIQYGACLQSMGALSNENLALKERIAELEKKLEPKK